MMHIKYTNRPKKILWFVNVPLPEASLLMGRDSIAFGGWIQSIAKTISKNNNIELMVAHPKFLLNHIIKLEGERIKYFVFPSVKKSRTNNNITNKYISEIIHDVKPDLVHVFGTEFTHSFEVAKICNNENIKLVISIQGLVSIIAKHYMACLPIKAQKVVTLKDFISCNNLRQQQKRFEKKGRYEILALQQTKHIIGRTTWDRACTSQINPKAEYYFCNETLRDEFYKRKWDLDNCEKHSIFISQGAYPIKGLHFMIEAMGLIVQQYENAKLYIAGADITRNSSYGKYIKILIKRHNLQDHIIFTGVLDEKQMCQRYLKSHVFVCPSSIENSPNSLGEAMILGVPSVASYVGGIPDMLKDKEEGFLYQHDAPYMLAYYVAEIFKDNGLAVKLSERARERGMNNHDRNKNYEQLIWIYEKVYNKELISKGSKE